MTPRQVSRELARQAVGSELAMSLRRLIHDVNKELIAVDIRRMVAGVKRELCGFVSRAIRDIDGSLPESGLRVINRTLPLPIPIRHGFLILFVHFQFFVSIGFVQMVEPVVRHQLIS